MGITEKPRGQHWGSRVHLLTFSRRRQRVPLPHRHAAARDRTTNGGFGQIGSREDSNCSRRSGRTVSTEWCGTSVQHHKRASPARASAPTGDVSDCREANASTRSQGGSRPKGSGPGPLSGFGHMALGAACFSSLYLTPAGTSVTKPARWARSDPLARAQPEPANNAAASSTVNTVRAGSPIAATAAPNRARRCACSADPVSTDRLIARRLRSTGVATRQPCHIDGPDGRVPRPGRDCSSSMSRTQSLREDWPLHRRPDQQIGEHNDQKNVVLP